MSVRNGGLRGLSLALALGGCDGGSKGSESGDSGGTDGSLAIVGSYVDDYGMTHEVTDALWTMAGAYGTSTFHLTTYSNPEEWVIGENDAANPYNAELWSRFDWVERDGHLYFCQTAYAAADEDAAIATPRGPDDDPAASGCGGFAWTDLTP